MRGMQVVCTSARTATARQTVLVARIIRAEMVYQDVARKEL